MPPPPLPNSQLVLINISDHHTRLLANRPASEAGSPPPTCLGILLGTQVGRAVDVSNSFEAPHVREAGTGAPLLNEGVLAKKLDQCEYVEGEVETSPALQGLGVRGLPGRGEAKQRGLFFCFFPCAPSSPPTTHLRPSSLSPRPRASPSRTRRQADLPGP